MPPPKWSNGKRGAMQGASALNIVKCTIRATPLPKKIWDFLRDNLALLRSMQPERQSQERTGSDTREKIRDDEDGDNEELYLQGDVIRQPNIKAEEFWTVFQTMCMEIGGEWIDLTEKLWAFGPQRAGTCILVDSRTEGHSNS
jgi:ribosome assembly protein 1